MSTTGLKEIAVNPIRGLRGWAFRHRGLDPGQASLPIQNALTRG